MGRRRVYFDFKRINSLYSNLSSLNILELVELRKNYKKLNYSITELDLQLLKLITFPFLLVLMSLLSSLIMLRIKHLSGFTFKIAIGLFFSVVIYYINNFFYVLGTTEKLSVLLATFTPLFILSFVNILMLNRPFMMIMKLINEYKNQRCQLLIAKCKMSNKLLYFMLACNMLRF